MIWAKSKWADAFFDRSIKNRLIDWANDWLIDWLQIDWLIDWLSEWMNE